VDTKQGKNLEMVTLKRFSKWRVDTKQGDNNQVWVYFQAKNNFDVNSTWRSLKYQNLKIQVKKKKQPKFIFDLIWFDTGSHGLHIDNCKDFS
jgi:hypothetical protein